MSERVDLSEFVAGFVSEADEHLRAARASLLALDEATTQGDRAPKAVRDLFRALHTIKGLASMVGVQAVVDLSHRMESVLRAADRAGGELPQAGVEPLLRGLEGLESRVAAVGRGERAAPAPAQLLDVLESLEPATGSGKIRTGIKLDLEPGLLEKLTAQEHAQIDEGVARGQRALRARFVPSPDRAKEGLTITTVRQRVSELGELVRVLPLSVPRSDEAPGGLAFELLLLTEALDEEVARAAGAEPAAVRSLLAISEALSDIDDDDEPTEGPRNVVRVDVRRLDRAMQQLSSLIVTRFKLGRAIAELAAQGSDVRELRLVADEHAKKLRDMREAILELRMIPVSEVLERIPLIVRGLRSETGKNVRVELGVAGAELDKSVAERLFPAIVHLVRNAVDHGIEPPEQRRAAGKPERGSLRISVGETTADRLELHVEDDGRGVDAGAVARRAGAPVPEGDAGLLELLVRPGLSTRSETTTTSGRGMGMDIVHRIVVTELGGELSMHTEHGTGTRFVLRVPLTVSIIDSLAFACGDRAFVVPLSTVEEVCDLDDVRMVAAPAPRGEARRMIERKGEIAAYFPLGTLFSLPESEARKVLIVRRKGMPFAFGVDRMLGQQEVVVRPLEDPLVRATGVTGSTDLGDGRPTLVLDLVALSGLTEGEVRA